MAGAVALLAAGLPYRLSLVVASLAGIGAGFVGGMAAPPVNEWLVIVGAGVVTFLTRASFIVFADPHKFPHAFRVALAFVPAAVLAAIVVPGLVMPHGTLDFTPSNPRLVAGLAAVAVAAQGEESARLHRGRHGGALGPAGARLRDGSPGVPSGC